VCCKFSSNKLQFKFCFQSIREAGGAFGLLEAYKENEYFRKIDEQKLEELKKAKEDKSKTLIPKSHNDKQ
jgi:hypothetical protein